MTPPSGGLASQDPHSSDQRLSHHRHQCDGSAPLGPLSKRRRLCHAPYTEDVESMLSWASTANLRSGWELYNKLRVYGLRPSAAALRLHPDRNPVPAVQHYRVASDLVRGGILQTLERRRLDRLACAAAAQRGTPRGPACSGVVADGSSPSCLSSSDLHHSPKSSWGSLPVDVMLQIVGKLESMDLHKAACISMMYKDVIGCVMQSLNFSWCHHFSPRLEINHVVRGASVIFNQLESISLRRHSSLQDRSLCMLIAANSGKLKSVDLSGCSHLSDAALDCIALHCRSLELLDMSSCTKMTAAGIVRLAKACPDLRSLNACGCELLTDTGLMSLAIHCSNLQEVNLGWCSQISDIGVCMLARGCPSLRSIDLCGCLSIGDTSVAAISACCTSLKSLGLHCLRHLTDASMMCLAESVSSLVSLNVSGCVLLSIDAVQAVLQKNPGLHTCSRRRSVIVSGCMGLVGIQCSCHNSRINWLA